jgi:NADPH:quinone reductase-like Zn-dependent oxidoreductase
MVTHFYMEGNTVGCDFCGIVVDAGPLSGIPLGTKVIGADFPYRPNNPDNGAFAEYAVSDARQTVIMPKGMDEITAAALGGIGWGTACLAFTDPDALYLKGWPSTPVEKPVPVLVYGGATATGIVAIQVLKQYVLIE